MSGCGTSLKGRAIVEVREGSMSVLDYDHWVRNFISVQQGAAEGRYKPEEVDWSGTTFYIKEAKDPHLTPVGLERVSCSDGKVKVAWTYWDNYEDGEFSYYDGDKPLEFSFDPYEGLTRLVLSIVPRDSTDEPVPESWNGKLLFASPEPPYVYVTQLTREVWDWIDFHTLDVGVSGDVLVTPYGEQTGVKNPIATREIAIRRAA
ncbi:hypothetical protein [Nonomuraea jabiensis]|uniref:hypothetical protein n=1 Tax=Nonomuraea jabiensis TaxID=882448 RepID=UPI003D725955